MKDTVCQLPWFTLSCTKVLNKVHPLLNTREISEILSTAEKKEQIELCTLAIQKKGGLGFSNPLL